MVHSELRSARPSPRIPAIVILMRRFTKETRGGGLRTIFLPLVGDPPDMRQWNGSNWGARLTGQWTTGVSGGLHQNERTHASRFSAFGHRTDGPALPRRAPTDAGRDARRGLGAR